MSSDGDGVRKIFKDDLRIFCYELYHYFIARRFWYKEYPEPIPITENSEFTEEFGKAVIVAWHDGGDRIKLMLHDDYPRFTQRTDNFKTYVTLRAKEMINEHDITQTQQIILVTAFMFDVYIYCYTTKQDSFLPYFVEFWSELFLILFYEQFNRDSGWQTMREECLGLSKKYDEVKAENSSTSNFTKIQMKVNYFQRDMTEKLPDDFYSQFKLVSRFYTVSKKLKKILPRGHSGEFGERQETLNIIFGSTMQQETYNLYLAKTADVPPKMTKKLDSVFKSLPKLEINVDKDEGKRKGKAKKKK